MRRSKSKVADWSYCILKAHASSLPNGTVMWLHKAQVYLSIETLTICLIAELSHARKENIIKLFCSSTILLQQNESQKVQEIMVVKWGLQKGCGIFFLVHLHFLYEGVYYYNIRVMFLRGTTASWTTVSIKRLRLSLYLPSARENWGMDLFSMRFLVRMEGHTDSWTAMQIISSGCNIFYNWASFLGIIQGWHACINDFCQENPSSFFVKGIIASYGHLQTLHMITCSSVSIPFSQLCRIWVSDAALQKRYHLNCIKVYFLLYRKIENGMETVGKEVKYMPVRCNLQHESFADSLQRWNCLLGSSTELRKEATTGTDKTLMWEVSSEFAIFES